MHVATLVTALSTLPLGNGGGGENGGGADQSIWSDMFTFQIPPTEKVLRTVIVYLGIAIVIRLFGKRLMAQMNSLDLVVVLLLSNVVQNAIIGEDNSLAGGLLGALVLVIFNAGLDRLAHRFPAVRRALEGSPTTVVTDGRVDEGALEHLGMTHEELHGALRHQGADRIDEVAKAQLAPGGDLTVDLLRDDQAASYGDLRAAMAELRGYLDERLPRSA